MTVTVLQFAIIKITFTGYITSTLTCVNKSFYFTKNNHFLINMKLHNTAAHMRPQETKIKQAIANQSHVKPKPLG